MLRGLAIKARKKILGKKEFDEQWKSLGVVGIFFARILSVPDTRGRDSTRGYFLHIAPNSPHLLKPWRFVAIFMLDTDTDTTA